MRVNTLRFGEIEIPEEKLILMPHGLIGFPELKSFFVIGEEGQLVRWLQSVDDPKIALPVINPFEIFSNFSVDISDSDLEDIELKDPRDAIIFLVMVIPAGKPKDATVNLKAPIVINIKNKKAKQVIALNEDYPVRYPLFPEGGA
ncbi:MAG: flagellar assembly protein FliW [Synergistetes bacterium]|nr:flagellar assembly protein FliW [Synergistota bacterium]MCX8127174.1 flagellar assembly protein FliW [Synergistota bacterium]MDW8191940.1 flagellar assembly protein FliW [Synergistota bacterium]